LKFSGKIYILNQTIVCMFDYFFFKTLKLINREMSLAIEFGKILQTKRLESGLSQEQLAQQCNLDRTYISLLERGLRQPTITSLFNISKVLGIKASELLKLLEDQYEAGN